MSLWRIEPLALHRVLVPGPEVLFQRAFLETIELVIYAFLLHGEDGRTVLVDTGLLPDPAALNASVRARKGDRSGFVDMGPRLAERLHARGINPDAILLTSFGPYAAGGLAEIGAPRIVVSARGRANLDSPEEPALIHALPDTITQRLRHPDVEAVDGMREILPGITMLETGIHHPASAAVVVATPGGSVAIPDPVFIGRNLREGLALGAAEHAAGWHALVRRLGTQCDAILPIHDPDPTPVPRDAWHHTLRPAAAGGGASLGGQR